MGRDNVTAFLLATTQIDSALGGLLVSYLATLERVEKLGTVYTYDEGLDRRSNKFRLKEVGASLMQYTSFLKTSAILGLAKSVEDLLVALREDTGLQLKFWTIAPRVENGKTAIEIRCLANVIKHHLSIIKATNSA